MGLLMAPAERITSERARNLRPSKASIPIALSGSSGENKTRATWVFVKIWRLGGALTRREDDVVRLPRWLVEGETARPSGLPEFRSGFKGYYTRVSIDGA